MIRRAWGCLMLAVETACGIAMLAGVFMLVHDPHRVGRALARVVTRDVPQAVALALVFMLALELVRRHRERAP